MIKVRIRNGLEPDPSTLLGGANEGYIKGAISDIINVCGVAKLSDDHLLVTETTPNDLTVLVTPGVGYIPNSAYDQENADTVRFWEAVIDDSDGDNIAIIAPNTSGSTRIDKICLKLDTTIVPDEYASNIATIVVVQGTPGAGSPTTPAKHLELAEVTVLNGATYVENADIADLRVQITIDPDFLPLTSVPVKTTGAAINTGTNDTDFATPKAIADSTLTTSTKVQTMTNKRNQKRVDSQETTNEITPEIDTYDIFVRTAQAHALVINNHASSTPLEGEMMLFEIKSDATPRAITYGDKYVAKAGIDLPTTTVASKTLTMLFKWSTGLSKWNLLFAGQEA